jgi:hypothetical protein
LPQQISSTRLGSRFDFSITFFNSEYTRKSSCVSLKPPLPALANGVRIARVITISSAFLEVLSRISKRQHEWDGRMNLHRIQSRGARSELSENGTESFSGHSEEVDGLISGEGQRVGSSRAFEAWSTRTARREIPRYVRTEGFWWWVTGMMSNPVASHTVRVDRRTAKWRRA